MCVLFLMFLYSQGREAEAPFLRRLQQPSLGLHAAGAHTGGHRDLPGRLGTHAYSSSVGVRTSGRWFWSAVAGLPVCCWRCPASPGCSISRDFLSGWCLLYVVVVWSKKAVGPQRHLSVPLQSTLAVLPHGAIRPSTCHGLVLSSIVGRGCVSS